MRVRAAGEGEVEHAGQDDVVGPAGASGDEPGVLLALAPLPDLRGSGVGAVVDGGHRAPPVSAAASTDFTMFW